MSLLIIYCTEAYAIIQKPKSHFTGRTDSQECTGDFVGQLTRFMAT